MTLLVLAEGFSRVGVPVLLADVKGDVIWRTKRRRGVAETMAKQTVRTLGSEIGRRVLRGVLGGILGGTRRRSSP